MKLSRLRNAVSRWLAPQPLATRRTHTAYTEQVMHHDEDGFTGRVYDYETGELLAEFEGRGGRKAAASAATRVLRKYRRK